MTMAHLHTLKVSKNNCVIRTILSHHGLTVYIQALTLNCNGIRNWVKRNTIFDTIRASQVDIAFLQETFSTPEVELQWSKE